VDVRARPELKYVGASDLIDANIPARFMRTDFAFSDKAKTYRTTANDHFVEDFEKLLRVKNRNKETPIILICQSGSRVPLAAETLHKAGFKQVYSQYQGFEGVKAKEGINNGLRVINGWKNSGLPWSYKLNKDAMYFNFDSTRE
jgi:rhodanese-related sulfurtransferase